MNTPLSRASLLWIVLLGLASTVIAQPSPAVPEQETVFNLPMDLFRAFKSAHNQKQRQPWGIRQIETVRVGLLRDDQVDDLERSIIDELTKPAFRVRLVAIKTPTFNPPDMELVGSLAPDARTLLERVAPVKGRDQLALWMQSGPSGWAKVIAYAKASPEQEKEVMSVLVARLRWVLQGANLANGYGPFRDELSSLYYQGQADPTYHRTVLLHRACEQLHREVGKERLPEFLFNWINKPQAGGE